MFWLKEAGEERVGLKQPAARETNVVPMHLGKTLAHQRMEAFCEFLPDLDAELIAEVSRFQLPGLDLQDHLANEPLVIGDRQRAMNRQLPALQHLHVLLP